jgi:acyl-CoA thioesterase-1
MGDLVAWACRVAYGARARALKAALAGAAALGALAAPALADPVRIVALGDSLTAGYGLPQDEGFVPVLQGWLDAAGVEVEMVNAGVSGDTTAGGLARLGWSLDAEVDAMIVALGGNDLLRAIPPESSRANLDAILDEVAAERGLPVLLIGLESPGNYGPAFKEAFDSMFPDLAAEYGVLHEVSFLGPLIEDLSAAQARAAYMQADGIHPNAAGVEVIVEAIGPRVAELAALAEAGGS